MRYLITDDSQHTLAAVEIPAGEGQSVTIAIERADDPDRLYVCADLHSNGTVRVGHWPQGDDWELVLHTAGTAGVHDTHSPGTAPRPAPALYTTEQITAALTTARQRAGEFTPDSNALDVLVRTFQAHLAVPGCNSPAPEEVTVRKAAWGFTAKYTAVPGRTFGPWLNGRMTRHLIKTAGLDHTTARDLLREAATDDTDHTATTETKR